MLKNILKLNGVQELSKNERKTINGGVLPDFSRYCGYFTFRYTQTQCLSLSPSLRPQWLGNGMCSALGTGTNCNSGNI
jgi:hypothetical protein